MSTLAMFRRCCTTSSNLEFEPQTSKYSVREFPPILTLYFPPMPLVGNVTYKSHTKIRAQSHMVIPFLIKIPLCEPACVHRNWSHLTFYRKSSPQDISLYNTYLNGKLTEADASNKPGPFAPESKMFWNRAAASAGPTRWDIMLICYSFVLMVFWTLCTLLRSFGGIKPLFSSLYRLFCKNTGGGGISFLNPGCVSLGAASEC
jgi:hypothetical protein